MRVRTLPGARHDLRQTAEYVAIDNPTAARALIRRIQGRLRDLAVFPRQGRPAGADRRELVIAGTPYVAIYRIAGNEVQVLRVLHGRQRRG